MKTIKLFWVKCGPGGTNFGDILTELLIKRFSSLRVDFASLTECDMFGVGSILTSIPKAYEGIVWTTGSMYNLDLSMPKAKLIALRGHLSKGKFTHDVGSPIIGDAGLISDMLVKPSHNKKYALGLIPHYVDYDDPEVKRMARLNNVCLLNICGDYKELIEKASQCSNILASSLHGLILADSLKVPNRRIVVSNKIAGDGFKYLDYYSVFGGEQVLADPLDTTGLMSTDQIISSMGDYDRPGIDYIREQVLSSLQIVLKEYA